MLLILQAAGCAADGAGTLTDQPSGNTVAIEQQPPAVAQSQTVAMESLPETVIETAPDALPAIPPAAPAAAAAQTPAAADTQPARAAPPPMTAAPKTSAPPAKTPPKVAAPVPAPARTEPPQAAALAKPEPQGLPPLALATLEQRLKDTSAIGVFTKLALKNQVDDLMNQFKAHYEGSRKSSLTQLRQAYDQLLLKVHELLKNGDPPLAVAIMNSRESIWTVLADPVRFAKL